MRLPPTLLFNPGDTMSDTTTTDTPTTVKAMKPRLALAA